MKAPQCSRSVWTNMIIVVLHINTYLQPSTFCTNPYKYDLSCFERSLQTHKIWCSMDQPHSFVFCFVFLFFFLLLFGLCIGILFIKKKTCIFTIYSFTKEGKEKTEAINNLKTRQMSVKYAATSDQKSLMCFCEWKPSSETFLII